MKNVMKKQQRQQQDSGFFSGSLAAVFLIGVNIAAYLFFQFSENGPGLVTRFILYPGNILQGHYWTLLTSGFLHLNWTHLGLNMLGIFIFGRVVERRLGFRTTLFIYVGALFISMLASLVIYAAVLQKNVAVLGASGAVMGLISAAMLIAPFSVTWEMLLPIPTMVKGWMFFYADIKGFLGGEQDGVSHLAHLCGFLSVMILVYFLSTDDRKKFTAGLVINVLSLAAAVWVKQRYFL